MIQPVKYALQRRFRPTIAPLTAAVGLALAASNLQAATVTVDTLADGSIPGECTLRDAFEAANTDATVAGCAAGSGADEVVFDSSLSGVLTLSSDMTLATSEITLTGPGADEVTVSGGGNYRLFTVSTAQGDLSISGLTLTDGYATGVYGGGAAAASQDAQLTLSDCVITNNAAANGSFGGAVLAAGAGLSVDNCEFSNNGVATVYTHDSDVQRGAYASSGGAIGAYASPQVTISNSTFYANEAGYGGALAFLACPDVTVDSSTISGGNYATFGGGIAWLGGSQGSLDNSTVDGNYAFGGGGVAVLQDSFITIDNSELTQNVAYSDAGGLLVGAAYGSGGGPVFTTAGDSRPAGGTTVYGPGTAYVYDSLFRFNEADRFGGGAAAKYTASLLYIDNGQIDNNTAGSAGGGPVAQGKGVDSASFGGGSISYAGGGGLAAVYQGYAYLVGNSTVIYNEGGQGGGMLAAYGGAGVAAYSQIAANTAYYGGGVMAGFLSASRGTIGGDPNYIILQQSSLSNNQAALGGGGLSLYANSAMIFGQSTVSGNQADRGGGAAAQGGLLAVKYSEVDGNSANNYGGGLLGFVETGCALDVVGSVISGNDAGAGGGAFSDGCETYFGYSAVTGNQASSVAGGLFIYGSPSSPAELLNTTITGNTAEIVGGLYGGQLTADFVTISHNLATGPQRADTNSSGRGVLQTGGAAFNTDIGDVQLENSIFAANTGPSGPRDLDILGAGSASVDYTLVQFPGSGLPGGTGNLLAVDPQLGPLSDNGGPTPTRALPDSSPAVDAANPTTMVEFDQRGEPYTRVSGGRADMGAFEFIRDAIFSDRFEQP